MRGNCSVDAPASAPGDAPGNALRQAGIMPGRTDVQRVAERRGPAQPRPRPTAWGLEGRQRRREVLAVHHRHCAVANDPHRQPWDGPAQASRRGHRACIAANRRPFGWRRRAGVASVGRITSARAAAEWPASGPPGPSRPAHDAAARPCAVQRHPGPSAAAPSGRGPRRGLAHRQPGGLGHRPAHGPGRSCPRPPARSCCPTCPTGAGTNTGCASASGASTRCSASTGYAPPSPSTPASATITGGWPLRRATPGGSSWAMPGTRCRSTRWRTSEA